VHVSSLNIFQKLSYNINIPNLVLIVSIDSEEVMRQIQIHSPPEECISEILINI
jgi:hypothetical protein